MKRILFFVVAFATFAHAADTLKFSDFTPETSPAGTDYVAGFRNAGVAGGNRRFSLAILNTYFSSNISITKGQAGLGSVDNTADTAKPVSTVQQTALNLKADLSALTAHTGNTSNPHSVTATQVGLGNVNNTSDTNKPVSTAQQTALNLKAALTQVVRYDSSQSLTATQQSQARSNEYIFNRGRGLYTPRIFSANMSAVGTSITFQLRAGIPFVNRAIMVRAVNLNDTSTGYTITNIAFAGGATRAAVNPVDASGTAAVWSTDSSLVVSAGSASWSTDGVYGVGYGNWVLVKIPARTDGGTYGVLCMRVNSSAAFRGPVGNGSRLLNGYSGLSINEFRESEYEAGNFVSTAQTSFVPSTTNSFYFPLSFQISVPDRVITVMGIGDSTTQGFGTTGLSYNAVNIACQTLSSLSLPIVQQGYAYEAKPTTFFYGVATTILNDASQRPDIMVIQAGSQNDTWTQANAQTMFASLMSVVRLARSLSVRVIVRCPYPTVSNDATADAARLWMRSQVLASNVNYIDAESTIGTGATPNRIQASYSSDGIHPNDTGEAAMVQLFVDAITKEL